MADLTIIMPSWNKEGFIAEALESVFTQQTSYTYQIIVADDHSTDGTLEIVEKYSQAHPGVITILRSESNQKLFKNIRRAYAICKTPYFCVLDPDDYWTDPLKIQKALDYLGSHPEFTIYATDTIMLKPDGTFQQPEYHREMRDSDFSDYLAGRAHVGNTLGSVFRNVVFSKGLPEKLSGELRPDEEVSFRGDSFRTFLHLREGKVHFVPECDAVYRLTDAGVYQGMPELWRYVMNARLFMNLWRYDDKRHIGLLKISRDLYRQMLAKLPELLLQYSGDLARLQAMGVELKSLRETYASNREVLLDAVEKELPIKRRIRYKGYRYLLRKGVLTDA